MTGNFFMLPNAIFEEKLPPMAFYIYCYLRRCHNPSRGCFPSIQTISRACGIAKSSVCKHLAWLEAHGYIERQHNFYKGRQCNNRYQLMEPSQDGPWGF